ncbi:hypothetical protein BB560_007016 [Smittium megazygosporum]|uniref:Uncharacterized protein n=1 Tax=Smittium megazygosporum TaxID=133381 RepID=A0A2T9XZE6_9FUNG|nr:hypothetical protein BB560_007016 [Smittium megazygosporum]
MSSRVTPEISECQELQQTKSVAARNRTSDLPDSGRPYEPKGYNVNQLQVIPKLSYKPLQTSGICPSLYLEASQPL